MRPSRLLEDIYHSTIAKNLSGGANDSTPFEWGAGSLSRSGHERTNPKRIPGNEFQPGSSVALTASTLGKRTTFS